MIGFGQLVIRELKRLIRDRRLLAVLLLLPLVYMFLFGYLYQEDKVKQIPLLYIDQDGSALSEQILHGMQNSETFVLIDRAYSEQEIIERVRAGEAYGALIIPPNLDENVTRTKQGEVLTVIDGSNLIIANRVLAGVNEVTQTYSQGIAIKRLEAKGINPDQRNAVQMGYRLLFNPGSSYSIYLLFGLLGTVLQSVTMLGMTLSLTGDNGEEEREVRRKRPWTYFGAKSIPYLMIGMLNLAVTATVLVNLFHMPFVGEIKLLIPLGIAFILSLLGMSFLVAIFCKTNVQATQITMLLVYPSFFLSGYSWPFSATPQWLTTIAQLLPVTHFLQAIRELAVKGNTWVHISKNVYALFLFAAVTIVIAFIVAMFERRERYGV